MDIKELLQQRKDLSTFLVHLTREYPAGTSAKENLISILDGQEICAVNPYGIAKKQLAELGVATEENLESQRVVCFTETPLEYVHLLTKKIAGRNIQFSPYGIVITKRIARLWDVNQVWYLDITPQRDWLTNPLNNLIKSAVEDGDFNTSQVAKLTPFIETMGTGIRKTGGRYSKEYWWEREWRHKGDFALNKRFIVICPEADFSEFEKACKHQPFKPRLIDPSWNLEQIIGHLAGFQTDDIDPF